MHNESYGLIPFHLRLPSPTVPQVFLHIFLAYKTIPSVALFNWKDVEGRVGFSVWSNIPVFAWKKGEKPQKPSVGSACLHVIPVVLLQECYLPRPSLTPL
jgi:hypothetical protein